MKPFVNLFGSTLVLLATALLTGCDIVSGISVETGRAARTAINQVDKAEGEISGRNIAVEACTNAVRQIYPPAELVAYQVDGLNKFIVRFKSFDATAIFSALQFRNVSCYTDNGSIIKIE